MGSVAVVSTGNWTAPANTAGNFRRPRRPAARWRIRPIGDDDHIRVHNDHILGRHNGNRQRVDKRPERPSRRRQQGLHLHRPTQPDAIGYTEATNTHARSGVTVFDRCPEHKVRRSDPRPIALGACRRNACHPEYAEDCKHRQPQGPHAHGSISPRTHHPAQRVPGLLRFVHRYTAMRIELSTASQANESLSFAHRRRSTPDARRVALMPQRSRETMRTLDRYDRGDSDRQRSEATTAGLNVPT